jgi:hypothetical protein
MYAIEDKDGIHFFRGQKELTLKEGFEYLNKIYSNEPAETKRIIDELKKKYLLKPMK